MVATAGGRGTTGRKLLVRCDVAVIGTGVAGCAAAVAAARCGAGVLLVGKGGGATTLASGMIQCGPIHDCRSAPDVPMDGIPLGTVTSSAPPDHSRHDSCRHPYRLFDDPGEIKAILEGSITAMTDTFLGYGNHRLFTCHGVPRDCATCLVQFQGAALERLRGARVLFAEAPWYAGMRGAYLASAAEELPEPPRQVDWVRLDLAPPATASSKAPVTGEDELAAAMKKGLAAHRGKDLVLIPPILGSAPGLKQLQCLSDRVGVPVWELPDPHSPLPGLRLQAALRRWLAEAGVRTMQARVAALECCGGRVRRLNLEGSNTTCLEADHVILCTGRFTSGDWTSEDGILRHR
ncbi:FAD-binding protein, partial [bacterium]|nr:FAD-binding protein [candidate division CSSED10-310 bacterium]